MTNKSNSSGKSEPQADILVDVYAVTSTTNAELLPTVINQKNKEESAALSNHSTVAIDKLEDKPEQQNETESSSALSKQTEVDQEEPKQGIKSEQKSKGEVDEVLDKKTGNEISESTKKEKLGIYASTVTN